MKRRVLFVAISFLVLLGVSFLGALPAHAVIYVSNNSANSITTWPFNTTGNIPPTTTIAGSATTLSVPRDLAVDANWIYVANRNNDSIDVFPIGATGDVAPTRSIQGASTTLNYPYGVAVDASWIYVANRNDTSIDVFPIGAAGDVAPTRSIQGAATMLNAASKVAVDASWIYVANWGNNSIGVFPIGATGDVAPTRFIQGASTTLNYPAGVAVDASWIYVGNGGNNSVDVFPIGATGDVAPTRFIQGAATTLNSPAGVEIDANWIYVANRSNNSVDVFPIGAAGDAAPTRSIQGAATTLALPSGIAVTPAGTVDLPETGQTTCYDAGGSVIPCAGTGQDGDIQAGVPWPSPRFTDNGDGTVTDNLTGLIWLRDANCFGTRTWTEALSDANSLSSGSCSLTDGSSAGDWRVPNVNELESLTNAEEANTATWLNTQGFTNVQSDGVWSSSTSAGNAVSAWVVSMPYDNVVATNKINNYYVWPVRAVTTPPAEIWETGQTTCYDAGGSVIPCTGTGQDGDIRAGVAWPSPRFTDNSDGTVTDNLTGLTWLQDANCFGTRTWIEALSDANSLADTSCSLTDGSAAGDWRLSNKKELHSLTDFSQSYPALQSGYGSYFTNVQSDRYWSSSTYADNAVNTLVINMSNGGVVTANKANSYFVWPVRGCTASFTDVPTGYWAEGYIKAIYCNGITTGYGDGTYRPANTVTRKQMAAFIIRAVEGEPAADYCGTTDPFPDVPYGDWACKYIKRLVELGITTGCGGGDYCPDDNTTRKQMAAFIIRAVEGDPAADYCGTTDPFPDVPYGDWACKYIKRLVELGITTGCGGGDYCPGDNTTRAQMAAFLSRAFLGMP